MINALVYSALIESLSNEEVHTILMHQLGKGNSDGFNLFSDSNKMRPFGYAVQMLSELKPNRLTTVIRDASAFSVMRTGQVLTATTGTIPDIAGVPSLYTVASKNNANDTMTIAIVNLGNSVYSKISLLNMASGSIDISAKQLRADHYSDNNEGIEGITPSELAIAESDLDFLEIPQYSLTLITVKELWENRKAALKNRQNRRAFR